MPRRFVIALIKHETNTFSPLSTPLSAFGHGEGPAFGAQARARFESTNTPMAAYLDLARREGAEIVTPVAAESWPSNKASRATFEALVRPLEDAVRKMTSSVADRLGLRERGLLREGMLADVIIFDPATIIDHATFGDSHQLSTGVRDVWVNGVAVLRDGTHTGATPGRFVKGPGSVSQ